ncbi:T9SS type A sorting domain-containing protein, partial [Flavobacterium sp. ZS1P14]|uniref:T9SS type A sorting domain-containing protein n=1 Tax=Flavobacterium sp. ZS1P14 TaxID=3401729 RepID=UPI003AB0FCC7
TDNCGTVSPTFTDGTVVITGCLRSQTRTWNVTDACGNAAAPVSRTATWTVDTTLPVITATGTPTNGTLGCNPTADAIGAALGTATATDNCGSVSPTFTDAAVVITGCLRSQTRTWNVTDACGNAAVPVSRTATWTVDTTLPVITATGTPTNGTLGCNPTADAIGAALGTATATDNCGSVSPTFTDAAVVITGCLRSQTRTWNVTDACGNAAVPVSRTATWTVDTTLPVITATGTPTNGTLGCNPTADAIGAALGTATATDNCGPVSPTFTDGSVVITGCMRSQTRTWNVTDACGNAAIAVSRTATWTVDLIGPTFSGIEPNKEIPGGEGGDGDLCSPTTTIGGVATADDRTAPGGAKVDIDFSQPRTGSAPTEVLNWTNGTTTAQSEYVEGMGVPQRLLIQGLKGNTHSIRIRHEAVKKQDAARHGYDFLMSWEQAVATAGNIGNGTRNELQNLLAQECDGHWSGAGQAACKAMTTSAKAIIPDVMGNPPNQTGNRNVDDVIQCFESQYGDRTIELEGTTAIANLAINFDGYSGRDGGDNYAWYTISWTSSSPNVMLKLAGRLAQGGGSCGYGNCHGAGSIKGNPYHFKLDAVDGKGVGERDNQVKCDEEQVCDVNIPVEFDTPTVTDNCTPHPTPVIVNDDVVTTNPDGSKTHCRTWQAIDDCNNASTFSQCITVVCIDTEGSKDPKSDEPITSNIHSETAGFTAYPVPFKDILTIKYDFDYKSDVKIEVYNAQGILVLTKTDTNSYLNKEIMLHLHSYKGQEQVYIVKVTTNRGSSTKKVISSN